MQTLKQRAALDAHLSHILVGILRSERKPRRRWVLLVQFVVIAAYYLVMS